MEWYKYKNWINFNIHEPYKLNLSLINIFKFKQNLHQIKRINKKLFNKNNK